jgi:chromosome segregation ATPase
MQLTKEFHSKTLLKNQDPDIFITELETLKLRLEDLDHKISDKAQVLHILNNLNENYDMEIKLLEHQINLLKEEGLGKELSVEDVRTELNLRYERINNNANHKTTMDHAYYMGTRFKGKCHWCGKIGHKSSECRQQLSGKPKIEEGN